MYPTGLATSVLLMVFFGACAVSPPEGAVPDRQAGYYYPALTSTETYTARAKTLKGASRAIRLGFVTAVTKQQLERRYAPKTAIFAKGERAEKLIIVALQAGAISTIHQGRGLLAQLTATSRLSPLFAELGVQGQFTFFDLAKLLGFETITISDGATWSHRIIIQ